MSDRITQLEQDLIRLNEAGRYVAMGGIQTCKDIASLRQSIALNTASLESFERSLATMQAQIDRLTQEASDE